MYIWPEYGEEHAEFEYCVSCGCRLVKANEYFDGDDAWRIDGEWFCDDCAESAFRMEVR